MQHAKHAAMPQFTDFCYCIQ